MLLNQPTVHEVLHYLALLTFFSSWVSRYPQLGPYILAMLCGATVPLGRWCTLSRVSIPSSSAQVILSSSSLFFPGFFLKVTFSLGSSLSLSPRHTCLLYLATQKYTWISAYHILLYCGYLFTRLFPQETVSVGLCLLWAWQLPSSLTGVQLN